MKKKLALLLSLIMVMFSLSACSGGERETTSQMENPDAAGAVKTGLAVKITTADSIDATDKDGLAQVDSLVVAVTVDSAGKIVRCSIDSTQPQITFTNQGKIITPLDTVILSKQELGPNYGMANTSPIGKDWNEQATALSEYVIGKTIEEVKGIAVNADGIPTDADLVTSVTIRIPDYIATIEKAVATAQDLGATTEDELGLGIVTTIAKSKDAGEEEGLAQAYSNYTATTFNADGAITSCIIDGAQINIHFTTGGKITSDIKSTYQTKNELGTDYGMIKASSITREWNEQAAAFASYVVGKTVDEVKGIAVTEEEGVPTDPDLASSVTVHVTDFMSIIEMAFESAK